LEENALVKARDVSGLVIKMERNKSLEKLVQKKMQWWRGVTERELGLSVSWDV